MLVEVFQKYKRTPYDFVSLSLLTSRFVYSIPLLRYVLARVYDLELLAGTKIFVLPTAVYCK